MDFDNPTLSLHICTACGGERNRRGRKTVTTLCAACRNSKGMSDVERFWTFVDKNTACECHSWEERCWLWRGHINRQSHYGSFKVKDGPVGAHVFAVTCVYGPLEKGLQALHIPPCVLRHCVRHVYPGTHRQNMQDAVTMERFPRGEAHAEKYHDYAKVLRGEQSHFAKLATAQVLAIRERRQQGETIVALAREYHVTKGTINRIVHYKTHKHLIAAPREAAQLLLLE